MTTAVLLLSGQPLPDWSHLTYTHSHGWPSLLEPDQEMPTYSPRAQLVVAGTVLPEQTVGLCVA